MKHTKQDSGASANESAQYLTFMLGGEAFGIGIMAVKEIIEFSGITEVPMMPESIRGVINLRGAVVPVMDLAARFGRPLAVPGKRTCIVIVELEADGERQVTGVVVDAVSAVLDIALAEIEPAPSFGTRIRGDFIGGMAKVNGKFVILLNVAHVLALDGLSALADSEAQAA
ncbi:chemotaxis protein CheW [Pseudoduganella umbonata]|nr:chemotaxis protein CheW [Pseudoduganella umbonata]MBB3224249.1 purine-binding chemotaxis protein CheW [Pseudoduganella umbonata]